MNQLEKSRNEITAIDAKMAELFEERMKICRDIAAYKKETGLPVRDVAREDEVVAGNCRLIKDPEIESYYVGFMRDTMEISCQYQNMLLSGMRVGYSGERGAFAHIASKKMFPTAELVAYPDFVSAYRAAEAGEVDCVVLPIENSYAGEVGMVMDLMFSGSLYINQVTDVPISHCLVGNLEANGDTVKTVVSHPQALDQCSEFIRYNKLMPETYSNTALAAQYVKNSGRTDIAAIASEETADIYGLKIIARDIQDNRSNTTRFAAFSRVHHAASDPRTTVSENFILVFTVRNEAGALAQALDIIGAHGFNMRSVRSRPMKELQWHYYFYIEAEGNINNENGANMRRELSALCDKLRLVGSYSAGNVSR